MPTDSDLLSADHHDKEQDPDLEQVRVEEGEKSGGEEEMSGQGDAWERVYIEQDEEEKSSGTRNQTDTSETPVLAFRRVDDASANGASVPEEPERSTTGPSGISASQAPSEETKAGISLHDAVRTFMKRPTFIIDGYKDVNVRYGFASSSLSQDGEEEQNVRIEVKTDGSAVAHIEDSSKVTHLSLVDGVVKEEGPGSCWICLWSTDTANRETPDL